MRNLERILEKSILSALTAKSGEDLFHEWSIYV